VSHDPTFGVYQDDSDGSFKIGVRFLNITMDTICRWRKIQGKTGSVGIVDRVYPDRNRVTLEDRQAYKQILLQYNVHRL